MQVINGHFQSYQIGSIITAKFKKFLYNRVLYNNFTYRFNFMTYVAIPNKPMINCHVIYICRIIVVRGTCVSGTYPSRRPLLA